MTRMRAGWEPEPWVGRGPLAARPSFQVSLEPKAGWGAGGRGSAGQAAPAREGASEGGRSRTQYPGFDTRSGWEPALREEVRDRTRTHFLRPD